MKRKYMTIHPIHDLIQFMILDSWFNFPHNIFGKTKENLLFCSLAFLVAYCMHDLNNVAYPFQWICYTLYKLLLIISVRQCLSLICLILSGTFICVRFYWILLQFFKWLTCLTVRYFDTFSENMQLSIRYLNIETIPWLLRLMSLVYADLENVQCVSL